MTSSYTQDTRPTGTAEGNGFKFDVQLDMTAQTYTAEVIERSQLMDRGWVAWQARRVEKGTFEFRPAKLGDYIVFHPRDVQLACCSCQPPGNAACGCLNQLKAVQVPDDWKEYKCHDTTMELLSFPVPTGYGAVPFNKNDKVGIKTA